MGVYERTFLLVIRWTYLLVVGVVLTLNRSFYISNTSSTPSARNDSSYEERCKLCGRWDKRKKQEESQIKSGTSNANVPGTTYICIYSEYILYVYERTTNTPTKKIRITKNTKQTKQKEFWDGAEYRWHKKNTYTYLLKRIRLLLHGRINSSIAKNRNILG